jgi:hypothetical protein
VQASPPSSALSALLHWRDALFQFSARASSERLTGCKLIVRCRDALTGQTSDYEGYRHLVDLLKIDTQRMVIAIQDAAADLVARTMERPHEDGKPVVETGAGAAGAERILRFSIGKEEYTLEAEGAAPVPFPSGTTKIITQFVVKISAGSPSENVPFEALHRAIDEVDVRGDKASNNLRQLIHRLNEHIREVAGSPPPHGERYLITDKGVGVHLNPSITWKLTKKLSGLFHGVYTLPVNPTIIAEAHPQRDQKLPARSRGGVPRDEKDDDPEG